MRSVGLMMEIEIEREREREREQLRQRERERAIERESEREKERERTAEGGSRWRQCTCAARISRWSTEGFMQGVDPLQISKQSHQPPEVNYLPQFENG